MNEIFRKMARKMADIAGSPWAFIICIIIVLVWLASGPFFDFSSEWQLIINTGTTILTFLMVVLLQNTQNRDTKAVQLKLDELIRAVGAARNRLLDLEDFSDDELKALDREFRALHDRAVRKNDGARQQ